MDNNKRLEYINYEKAIRLVRGRSGVETTKTGSEKLEKSFLKQAQEGGENGTPIHLLL